MLATSAVSVAALALAPTAAAHVTASTDNAVQGESSVVTLTVPTESEDASTSTVGLDVALPSDADLTSVRVQPVPGWDAEITRDGPDGAPTAVSWEATDGGVGPDEFVQLVLSVGPLPDTDNLALPAVQHYSDGTDAEWTQQVTGDAEADRPAPTIDLLPASDAASDAAGTGDGESGAVDTAGSGPLPWITLGISVIALVLAALNILLWRRAAN